MLSVLDRWIRSAYVAYLKDFGAPYGFHTFVDAVVRYGLGRGRNDSAIDRARYDALQARAREEAEAAGGTSGAGVFEVIAFYEQRVRELRATIAAAGQRRSCAAAGHRRSIPMTSPDLDPLLWCTDLTSAQEHADTWRCVERSG